MKKLLVRIGIGLGVLLLALLLGRNLLIKHGAGVAARAAIGIDLTIDDVSVGLFDTRIRLEGLRVHNPPGFGDRPLLVAPVIDVDYELASLLGGTLHCTTIEVNVQEVNLVKNAAGEVNLNKLKAVSDQDPGAKDKPESQGKDMAMQIDRLILTVGEVHHVTLDAAGKEASMKTIALHLDHEEFKDLNSPTEIVAVVVLRTVTAAGLHGVGVAVDGLKSGLSHVGGAGMDVLKGLGSGAKGLLDKLRGKD